MPKKTNPAISPAASGLAAGASNTGIELRLLMEAIYLKHSYDFRDYSGAS